MINQVKPPLKHFRYSELPKEVRQKLLTLQNGTGDYFKTADGSVGSIIAGVISIFVFFVVISIFAGVYKFFRSEGYQAVWFAILIVLLMWCGRYIWLFVNDIRSPIREGHYVTPTQHIHVPKASPNPIVTCMDLTDCQRSLEINSYRTLHRAGKRTYAQTHYEIIFTDKFGVSHKIPMKNAGQAQQWCGKFLYWIDYANHAAQQGNRAYFDGWDIFKGAVSLPQNEIKPNRTGLYVTLAITAASIVFLLSGFTISRFYGESDTSKYQWENAKSANTVSEYIRYQSFRTESKHIDEAKKACLSLYDEEIKHAQDNQAEILVKMLENSRNSMGNTSSLNPPDNAVYVKLDRSSISGGFYDDFKLRNHIYEKLTTNFPNTVLKPYGEAEIDIDRYINRGAKNVIKIEVREAKTGTGKSKVSDKSSKYEMTCEVKIGQQTVDSFTEKVTTVDEFNAIIDKHLKFEK